MRRFYSFFPKTTLNPFEYYAMERLTRLLNTVDLVKKNLNTALSIEGILLTMYDKRNNICNDVVSEVKKHFEKIAFDSMIPRNVRLSEAPSYGKPIILYDVKSKGAESYLKLAKEVIVKNSSSGINWPMHKIASLN